MYINAIGHYIPENRINNEYFKQINGLDADWLLQRTGIHTRSKISEHETIYSMGANAVKTAIAKLPYNVSEVDLIVAAGYTITDSVGTVGHRAQREFNIPDAKVVAVTSACSSFVNGMEIIETYFAAGKSTKALIICSEANSIFNDYTNPKSGHLWGDGAVAVFISKEPADLKEPKIIEISTKGLGHIGKGPDGVCLYTNKGGISMHDGKDVFHYACTYMAAAMEEVLSHNNLKVDDVSYFACHQANLRIIANIAHQWKMPEHKFFNNISELGNTGSASAMLALSQNLDKVKPGDYIGLAVFGGGYSSGAMLIQF